MQTLSLDSFEVIPGSLTLYLNSQTFDPAKQHHEPWRVDALGLHGIISFSNLGGWIDCLPPQSFGAIFAWRCGAEGRVTRLLAGLVLAAAPRLSGAPGAAQAVDVLIPRGGDAHLIRPAAIARSMLRRCAGLNERLRTASVRANPPQWATQRECRGYEGLRGGARGALP